jgi:hypothetical protein
MNKAVDLFRQRLVASFPDTHPLLYVNLIGTAVSDQQITDFMVSSFSAEELAAWAILDTHVYYAWNAGLSGCSVRRLLTVLCCALLCYAVMCCDVMCCAVMCLACCDVLCCAVLCCALL